MKTIAIQGDSVGTMSNPQGLLSAAGVWSSRSHRASVEWLPVPSSPRQNAVTRKVKSSEAPGFSVSLAAEKFLFASLGTAGVIGIAYGFSCLVDLVQNWAAVNASIGHMIN
jgi:hypothetical protein